MANQPPSTRPQAGRLSLKDALFLGFCGVLILFTRAVLRLRLSITGHSMFFTLFFLFLARACIPFGLAASFTGLLTGLMAMLLGLGKGGPLLILKFVLPALVVDLGAFVFPRMFSSYGLCLLVAAAASATKFLNVFVVDTFLGMDAAVVWQHATIEGLSNALFGMAGALLIPPVTRKLLAYGIIQPR